MTDTIPPDVDLPADTELPLRPSLFSADPGPGPVDPDDLPWATWMEGVQAKVLRADAHTNTTTMLVKFEPGVTLPTHRHMGPVHAYTIQGRWHYLEYDWTATTGSYVHEQSLGTHTFATYPDNTEDTLVIFVMQGGQILVNDEGAPWWFEDAETILHLYRLAIQQQGDEFPDHLFPA